MGPSLVPREAGTRISHDVAGGNEYATVVRSVRDGAGAARKDRACPGGRGPSGGGWPAAPVRGHTQD